MEKTLRVLGGGEEDGAGHSHSHSPATHTEPGVTKATGASSSTSQNRLRKRAVDASDTDSPIAPDAGHEESLSTNGPSKLSAYLNLFGDFVHNMWVPGGLQPLLSTLTRPSALYPPLPCFDPQHRWIGVSDSRLLCLGRGLTDLFLLFVANVHRLILQNGGIFLCVPSHRCNYDSSMLRT